MKFAGIDFKVIDCSKINDFAPIELIPNPDNNPKIELLSRKITFLKRMKDDLKFHDELTDKKVYLDNEENKASYKKYKARTNRRIKKVEGDIAKLCKELGWTK